MPRTGMNAQTHTYTCVRAHTQGAADKVQCLLPSSFSHELGMRDLLVGLQGTVCMLLIPPPTPQLHNWETVSKTLANTDTHLKIPSYVSSQVKLFSPPPEWKTPLALRHSSEQNCGCRHTYTHHPGCCPLLCFFQLHLCLSPPLTFHCQSQD